LLVEGLAERQPDLAEEQLGPPVRAAFKDGVPTRAAEAFAEKLGVAVGELRRVDTPKGEYLAGTRRELGRPTSELLPGLLEALIREIPFRKSMRWADLDVAFGRPIQWLVALFGGEVVGVEYAGVRAGRTSYGHRFLAPATLELQGVAGYLDAMRAAHVLVDPTDRRAALARALDEAARASGTTLIPDEFLMDENLSLVEEPFVVVGGFEEGYLELPERVILEVAKGHQRYFGVRSTDGRLAPRYLAVVNTALEPELIRKGNDRVMRARLADAQFFWREDRKIPLAKRREKLAGVVFQKRLGTVLEKATRIEQLAGALGRELGLDAATIVVAEQGAHLAKCDLVSYMVGEFPELQGEMGAAYARSQGIEPAVADVIRDHYRPKGASDDTAPTDAAALVAIADRLDTLVGCFAIGLSPTGTADPFGLRRALLGVLRTMFDRGFDLALSSMIRAAYAGYAGKKLDLSEDEAVLKIGDFAGERLRVLLSDKWPADAVRACLGAGHDRPLELRRRVMAVAGLDAATRAQVGEVFKRATNIASQATPGEPGPVPADAHASEVALFEAYARFCAQTDVLVGAGDYAGFFGQIAEIAPVLSRYFTDVFVMTDDLAVRESRLRLMRGLALRCARVAQLEQLASG
jgi:glycyl-tRNA synthetase beta chain